jgi:amino acid transporter
MRILIQFIGQAVGLLILRKTRPAETFPYKMPLFPLPIYIAIVLWVGILFATGLKMMLIGLAVIAAGTLVYFIKAKRTNEWPFNSR